MAVIETGPDLGWTDNQDITSVIAGALAALDPGDELRLSHMYKISGGPYTIPGGVDADNPTIISAVFGGGLEVTDPDLGTSGGSLLQLGGSYVTLRNLTVTMPTAIDWTVLTPNVTVTQGTHYNARRFLYGVSCDHVTIEYCYINFNGKEIIWLEDCDDLLIQRNEIIGGQYGIYIWACYRPIFRYNFHNGGPSEAIKTGTTSGFPSKGVRDAIIEDSVFNGQWRDGVDTTGGYAGTFDGEDYESGEYSGGIIRRCIFRRTHNGPGGGIDLKQSVNSTNLPALDVVNVNILLEDNEYINCPNAVSIATVDNGDGSDNWLITTDNMETYVPHNILIRRQTFSKTIGSGTDTKGVLLKCAYNVTVEDSTILGALAYVLQASDGFAGSAPSNGAFSNTLSIRHTGLSSDSPTPQAAVADRDVTPSFAYGPQAFPDWRTCAVRAWDGEAWVTGTLRQWDGEAWVTVTARVRNV
jgi:hypothetical protein